MGLKTFGDDAGPMQSRAADSGRNETELERADRNLTELQQELRVLTTAVQIMFAFLLAVPFSAGFSLLTPGEKDLYLVVLSSAAAAAGLFIAPSAMNRLRFRHGDKPHLRAAKLKGSTEPRPVSSSNAPFRDGLRCCVPGGARPG